MTIDIYSTAQWIFANLSAKDGKTDDKIGYKANNYSILSTMVTIQSQQIAGKTAIYQDLQAKQSSGETLTAGEEKFMSDYNTLLQQSGLQINSNGELEDIPTKRKGRRRN